VGKTEINIKLTFHLKNKNINILGGRIVDVHIYFDASFNDISKAGGIAVYINDEIDQNYIYEKRVCNNSTDAEMLALINAFKFLLTNNKYTNVYIHGDCYSTIDFINKKKYLKDKRTQIKKELGDLYVNLINRGYFITLQWVPRRYNTQANYISKHGSLMPVQNPPKIKRKIDENILLVDIKNIKVPFLFMQNPPKIKKINESIEFYKMNNSFDKSIIVMNQNNCMLMIDGYCRYLAAKRLGIGNVPVQMVI
jgi:ribonuclease HI